MVSIHMLVCVWIVYGLFTMVSIHMLVCVWIVYGLFTMVNIHRSVCNMCQLTSIYILTRSGSPLLALGLDKSVFHTHPCNILLI